MMIVKLMKYLALPDLITILYLLILSKKFTIKHLLNIENILETNNLIKIFLEINIYLKNFLNSLLEWGDQLP